MPIIHPDLWLDYKVATHPEDASVAQFPKKIGELGVATLIKVIKGETVPPFVDTGTAMVTKENVNDFE